MTLNSLYWYEEPVVQRVLRTECAK